MLIRRLAQSDVPACLGIAASLWGKRVSLRIHRELSDALTPQPNPPAYFVAVDSDMNVAGFAGAEETRLMHGVYNFVWCNVAARCQRAGIGTLLTNARITHVTALGGRLIQLMTQKPLYYRAFGFKRAQTVDGWTLMLLKLGKLTM